MVLVASTTYTQHLENGWPVEAGLVTYRIDRVRFRFSSDDARWHVPAGAADTFAAPGRADPGAAGPAEE